VEIRRIKLRPTKSKILVRTFVNQWLVKCLPRKYKALSSNPTTKKGKKEGRKERRKVGR
jgi:hypothetical protein